MPFLKKSLWNVLYLLYYYVLGTMIILYVLYLTSEQGFWSQTNMSSNSGHHFLRKLFKPQSQFAHL